MLAADGDGGLAFFSRITAGQSHELANVFNIINELVGLQADVLSGAGPEDRIDRQKLRDVCGRIRAQIERGGEIVRRIHGFAHSADVPRAVFDVKEALCRVVFLTERWTRLKEVSLTAEVPDGTIALENNPFLFQRAVFLCIDAALQAAGGGKRIVVGFSVVVLSTSVPRGRSRGRSRGSTASLPVASTAVGPETSFRRQYAIGPSPKTCVEYIVEPKAPADQHRATPTPKMSAVAASVTGRMPR